MSVATAKKAKTPAAGRAVAAAAEAGAQVAAAARSAGGAKPARPVVSQSTGERLIIPLDQLAASTWNVREVRDVDSLAGSIEAVGLLVALIVVPVALVDLAAGDFPPGVTHVVVDGHRRLAALRQLGAVVAACDVRDDLDTPAATRRTMAVTGMARDPLTPVEEAKAMQLLLDLGMTQSAVGRATGRPAAAVKAARAAASLTGDTLRMAEEYHLDLTSLAAIADLGELAEKELEEITGTADDSPGQLPHTIESIRQDRAREAAFVAAETRLGAAGITCFRGWKSAAQALDHLTDHLADDLTAGRTPIDPAGHTTCPGHAVMLQRNIYNEADQIYETPVCVTPKAHRSRWSSGPSAPPVDKEERAEKLARSRQMAAAEVVRRDFLRLMTPTTANGHVAVLMSQFAMELIESLDHRYTRWASDSYYRTKSPELWQQLTALVPRYFTWPAAAVVQRRLWVQVVTAMEAALPKDVHAGSAAAQADAGRYLAHLVDLGYTPCETEQLLIDAAAEAVDIDSGEHTDTDTDAGVVAGDGGGSADADRAGVDSEEA